MIKQKSLNSGIQRIYHLMKKRGQSDPISVGVGVIILGGILLFGFIGTHIALQESRYMVDNEGVIYDLTKCNLKDIDKENLQLLRDLDDIKRKNYTMAKC